MTNEILSTISNQVTQLALNYIIQNTQAYYDKAFSNILIIFGIILGLCALAVPIVLFLIQNNKYKILEERITSKIANLDEKEKLLDDNFKNAVDSINTLKEQIISTIENSVKIEISKNDSRVGILEEGIKKVNETMLKFQEEFKSYDKYINKLYGIKYEMESNKIIESENILSKTMFPFNKDNYIIHKNLIMGLINGIKYSVYGKTHCNEWINKLLSIFTNKKYNSIIDEMRTMSPTNLDDMLIVMINKIQSKNKTEQYSVLIDGIKRIFPDIRYSI